MTESKFNRLAKQFERGNGKSLPQRSVASQRELTERCRGWIASHPAACISVAACIGVGIGWWLKRR
jgi:ElaB/YqjD/DUF883 family membrane-anchored ribosome-binding protein